MKPSPSVTDADLRRYGFSIASRPTKGQSLWRRGRKQYTRAQAASIAEREAADREARAAAGIEAAHEGR